MKIKLDDKNLNYALFGLIYGDGHYRDGWIRITHSSKYKYHVKWLEEFCKKNALQYTVKYGYKKKCTFGIQKVDAIAIKVKDRRHFDKYGRIYNSKTGKREVSKYVLERMTPLGLLLWYLDDGNLVVHHRKNKVSRFAYLNTQAFDLKDNKRIQKMFKDRFGIETRIHLDSGKNLGNKTYHRIYLSATAFRKFYDTIRDLLQFVPEDFKKKFDMQYIPNKLKTSYEYTQKYNGQELQERVIPEKVKI